MAKDILDDCGMSNIWLDQNFPNEKLLKLKVKQTLIDRFIQESEIPPKALYYHLYKHNLEFESYLIFYLIKLL